jgi:putative transposase
MLEVTKNAPQMAIMQLGQAFKNFFAKRAAYPNFRKRGRDDRFTLSNDQFKVNDSRIRIPHIGWVRMREALRFEGKILSATISKVAGRWFVSLTVETREVAPEVVHDNQMAVGVDLGVSCFATLSTGEEVKGPRPHKALMGRLRRLSKSLSRKVKSSKQWEKAKLALSKLHARIANIRKDAIHQLTTKLVKTFDCVVIEDLNVKGMLKNKRLSRSIADIGFYEFRRQLDYKAKMRGKTILVADRWFASSKICSSCGHKVDILPLSSREWDCPQCHTPHRRDVNAAKNLKSLAVSSTVSACGASSDGVAA